MRALKLTHLTILPGLFGKRVQRKAATHYSSSIICIHSIFNEHCSHWHHSLCDFLYYTLLLCIPIKIHSYAHEYALPSTMLWNGSLDFKESTMQNNNS